MPSGRRLNSISSAAAVNGQSGSLNRGTVVPSDAAGWVSPNRSPRDRSSTWIT